jgi:hypothetical protein
LKNTSNTVDMQFCVPRICPGMECSTLDTSFEQPEYKSSGAGSAAMSVASSSISQSKKATVEIDAGMLQNAVNALAKIQQEVF